MNAATDVCVFLLPPWVSMVLLLPLQLLSRLLLPMRCCRPAAAVITATATVAGADADVYVLLPLLPQVSTLLLPPMTLPPLELLLLRRSFLLLPAAAVAK